jgi:hypothetical protein
MFLNDLREVAVLLAQLRFAVGISVLFTPFDFLVVVVDKISVMCS